MLSQRSLAIIRQFVFLLLIPASYAAGEENIRVWFSTPQNVQPGSIMDIAVMMSSTQQLGGIDITIRYEDSLLSFVSVEQDSGLSNWEYFHTTHDDSLNTVQVFSIADAAPPQSTPDSTELFPRGAIATYHFFVAPNWLADSGRVAFDFIWPTCGVNAASTTAGDSLIIVRRIFDVDGVLLWDETDNSGYPDINRPPMIGVPDSCLIPGGRVASKIDFYFGEALNFYICGDFDFSGSVSIADAVAAVNYIFGGGPPPSPLEAGDVDCSGTVSIADAVYLVNYIFGGGPAPCAGCN